MNDCSYRDKLLIYVEVLNREEEEVGLIFFNATQWIYAHPGYSTTTTQQS